MSENHPQVVTEREIKMRWLAAGIVFGAAFPLVGWFMAAGGGVRGFEAAHRAQPVLYIVDLTTPRRTHGS